MTKKKLHPAIHYPYQIIKPIADFLKSQTKKLEKKKKKITKDDPFSDLNRGEDKAAPDTEVTDRSRHESLTAIKDQLDRKLVQTQKALARIKNGQYGICERCDQMIDTDRLMIYPEATLCIKCEQKSEKKTI